MFNWSRKFNIEISDVEIFEFLTELNGIEPTQWFITKNGGKNKKDVLAYILNNTPEHIQLIAVKGKKKNCYIDKESVITYNKTDDIETLTVARGEFYEIKIKLKNGMKYVLGAFPHKSDALHKESMKALQIEYKEASKKAQVSTVIANVLILVLAFIIGFFGDDAIKRVRNQIMITKTINAFIENEEYKSVLETVLEPYDKADLKLTENFTTVQYGDIKMNIPSNCYVNPEYGDDEGNAFFTNGVDINDNSFIDITIHYEPYDFSTSDELNQKSEIMYEYTSDVSEKEFGFPITNMYEYKKAMWMADINNLNYLNYKELVLYYMLLTTKTAISMPTYKDVYDVSTDSYCGFINTYEPFPTMLVHIELSFYDYDNPEVEYSVSVACKTEKLDEAYKILNSVELVTK